MILTFLEPPDIGSFLLLVGKSMWNFGEELLEGCQIRFLISDHQTFLKWDAQLV